MSPVGCADRPSPEGTIILKLRPKPSKSALLVVAGCCGAFLAGAVAFASAQTSSATIHGCYSTKTGVLRRISASGHCKSGERGLNWNVKGRRGRIGLTGSQGAIGPQGGTGSQGTAGADGTTGPQGPQGDAGATGPQGPQGDTGPTGPQGPKGDTGASAPVEPPAAPTNFSVFHPGDNGGYNSSVSDVIFTWSNPTTFELDHLVLRVTATSPYPQVPTDNCPRLQNDGIDETPAIVSSVDERSGRSNRIELVFSSTANTEYCFALFALNTDGKASSPVWATFATP